MQILVNPISYQHLLEKRTTKQIELLVIHCTELPDLATARTYAEKILYPSGTGNSGHYYIDRDGTVHQWVKPEMIAHHVKGHNRQSVGIELVNSGRYPNWHHSQSQTPNEAYPKAQIKALIELINELQFYLPELKHIAGHEDIDTTQIPATDNPNQLIQRKIDPGPLFSWENVMQNIRLINIGSNAKNYE